MLWRQQTSFALGFLTSLTWDRQPFLWYYCPYAVHPSLSSISPLISPLDLCQTTFTEKEEELPALPGECHFHNYKGNVVISLLLRNGGRAWIKPGRCQKAGFSGVLSSQMSLYNGKTMNWESATPSAPRISTVSCMNWVNSLLHRPSPSLLIYKVRMVSNDDDDVNYHLMRTDYEPGMC